MENVGDREIILKGSHHQHDRRQENYCETSNARATRSFT
jgi:hypothetical protein